MSKLSTKSTPEVRNTLRAVLNHDLKFPYPTLSLSDPNVKDALRMVLDDLETALNVLEVEHAARAAAKTGGTASELSTRRLKTTELWRSELRDHAERELHKAPPECALECDAILMLLDDLEVVRTALVAANSEKMRLRTALVEWRAEWLNSAYEPWTASAHIANETISRIDAILAPNAKV